MYNRKELMEVEELERRLHQAESSNAVLTKRIEQYQLENSVLEKQVERWKTNYYDVMTELCKRKEVVENG